MAADRVATGELVTPDAIERFRRDGACVIRGALDEQELDAIRNTVDALDEHGELADLSALADSPDEARFRAGVDHWRHHPQLTAVATEGTLPHLAAAVLDTRRLWLYEDSVLVKEPGATVETRWHTDDGYFHVDGRQLATMWVALDPAPLTAGALRFLRGSHLDEERYHPTLFVTDDPIPGTVGIAPPQLDFEDPRVFGFDLAPGDVTIHHARTLHAAGGNTTDAPRRALSIRYCGDDAVISPKPGAPAKPGFDQAVAGTPLAANPALGLPEARLG